MKLHKLSINNYKILTWNEKFPNNDVDILSLPINNSWDEFINCVKFISASKDINKYLSYCLKQSNNKVNIFPYPDLLFSAFNVTPLDKIKVVILGQDPYFNWELHNNKYIPQAMGLSFSVPIGINIPPSLDNIYNNLLKNGHFKKKPTHGNLTFWAYQGCLLLNPTLTVQQKCPNGHQKYWNEITDDLIKFISDKTNNIVFVLWGLNSLQKLNLIDNKKHLVLISSHPSGQSYNNPLRTYKPFSQSDHFGQINEYLTKVGKSSILWQFL